MTSLATRPTSPALHAPARPGILLTLAQLGARTGEAIRAARAYESADTATARQRILDEFASGVHRAA